MGKQDQLVTLTMARSAKESFINFKRSMEKDTGLALSTTQTINALTSKNLDAPTTIIRKFESKFSKNYAELADKYIQMFRNILKVSDSERAVIFLSDYKNLVFKFDEALQEHLSYKEVLVLRVYFGLIPEFDNYPKDPLFSVLGINNFERVLANIKKRASSLGLSAELAGLIEFTTEPRKPILSLKSQIAA